MPFALLFIYLLSSVGSASFAKLVSGELRRATRAKYSLFLTVNGCLACFFFWMFGGFSVSVTAPTLVYALIYAIVVAAILVLTAIAYNLMSVSNVGIVRSGCGLVCTAAVGALLFSEKITTKVILRIALTLISVLLVMLALKKQERPREKQDVERKTGSRGVLLAIVLILNVIFGCANTVTVKCFTLDTRVADENSFFFFTNVFLAIGCALVFAFESLRDRNAARDAVTIFKPRALIGISGDTLSSNVGSLVSAWIIAGMDVSVYTPVMSSIGIIAGFLGSVLYREKLGILSYIAIIAALAAVII